MWSALPARDLAPLVALQLLAALTVDGLAFRWAAGQLSAATQPHRHNVHSHPLAPTCGCPCPQAPAVHHRPPAVHGGSAPGPGVPPYGHSVCRLQSRRGPRPRRPAAPAGLARPAGQPSSHAAGHILQPLRAAAATGVLGPHRTGQRACRLAGRIRTWLAHRQLGLQRVDPFAPLRRWA